MGFWNKVFGKSEDRTPPTITNAGTSPIDPTVTPIDNPLDYREDGSIHEGDPTWAMMQRIMETGESAHGVQRPDGTWDIGYRKD
jgi:hypothetical protein